jgi:two-component system sensor histidine kinase KdpD
MTQDFTGPADAGPNGSQTKIEAPRNESRAVLASTLLNLSIVAALTLAVILFGGSVSSAAVPVLYFVPVLLATLLWNLQQGMIAAFASALAMEFFYFEPRFSLAVSNRRDVMAELIFLAAALLAGYLVDEIRRLRSAPAVAAAVEPSSVAPDRPALRFGGPPRTVPERIAEFLAGRPNAMYCDQCIQDQLGLKWRQQVQLVTATLAVTDLFRRDSGSCQTCNQFKQVIRHVKAE